MAGMAIVPVPVRRKFWRTKFFSFLAGVTSKKVRSNQNMRPRAQDQKAEMKQQKYRYLYQVRTAHGDVISQVSLYKYWMKMH